MCTFVNAHCTGWGPTFGKLLGEIAVAVGQANTWVTPTLPSLEPASQKPGRLVMRAVFNHPEMLQLSFCNNLAVEKNNPEHLQMKACMLFSTQIRQRGMLSPGIERYPSSGLWRPTLFLASLYEGLGVYNKRRSLTKHQWRDLAYLTLIPRNGKLWNYVSRCAIHSSDHSWKTQLWALSEWNATTYKYRCIHPDRISAKKVNHKCRWTKPTAGLEFSPQNRQANIKQTLKP